MDRNHDTQEIDHNSDRRGYPKRDNQEETGKGVRRARFTERTKAGYVEGLLGAITMRKMMKETPEQQMKDSDTIFTAISTGDFDNFQQGRCEGYVQRNKQCPDCPREYEIELSEL